MVSLGCAVKILSIKTFCPSTKYQILEPSVALSFSCHLCCEIPFATKSAKSFRIGYDKSVTFKGFRVKKSQASDRSLRRTASKSTHAFLTLLDSKYILYSDFFSGLGTGSSILNARYGLSTNIGFSDQSASSNRIPKATTSAVPFHA